MDRSPTRHAVACHPPQGGGIKYGSDPPPLGEVARRAGGGFRANRMDHSPTRHAVACHPPRVGGIKCGADPPPLGEMSRRDRGGLRYNRIDRSPTRHAIACHPPQKGGIIPHKQKPRSKLRGFRILDQRIDQKSRWMRRRPSQAEREPTFLARPLFDATIRPFGSV
jgi:hypothetical protein